MEKRMASPIKVDRAPHVRTTSFTKRSLKPLRLSISERRILLMFGDVAATSLAVALGLYLWSQRAHEAFNANFIVPQLHWFVLLPGLWLILASANDYYNLHVAAN